MNASPFRLQDAAEVCDTNLYELIQVVCLTLSRQLRRQRVSCSIDVERQLQFPLHPPRVTEMLEQMVVDSLRAMPEGGQLDVTAVVGPAGPGDRGRGLGDRSRTDLRVAPGRTGGRCGPTAARGSVLPKCASRRSGVLKGARHARCSFPGRRMKAAA